MSACRGGSPGWKGRQGKVTEVVHSHLPAHMHAHGLRAAETHACSSRWPAANTRHCRGQWCVGPHGLFPIKLGWWFHTKPEPEPTRLGTHCGNGRRPLFLRKCGRARA